MLKTIRAGVGWAGTETSLHCVSSLLYVGFISPTDCCANEERIWNHPAKPMVGEKMFAVK